MEKDIVGKDPVDSEKEPDLINLSTPIKVLRITVYSQIVLEMPLVYFLCNVFWKTFVFILWNGAQLITFF